MNAPVTLPPQLPLALYWATFHIGRALRRPATVLWSAAAVLLAAALRFGGDMDGSVLADLELTLVLPLFAMFFGSGGLREEVEDQTLTYAFVRPLARRWIYLARTGAAAVVATAPVLVGLALAVRDPMDALRWLGVGVLAGLAYTSIFAAVGLVMRRPTLVGLALVLGWEQGVGAVPGFLSRLTLQAHVRGLAGLSPRGGPLAALHHAPPVWASLLVVIAVLAICVGLASWWVSRRELLVPK
jgi:ABC-2 type transport system permease protein